MALRRVTVPPINFITVNDFTTRYLNAVPQPLRPRVLIAYVNTVASLPLSILFSGVTYYRVRDAMLNTGLATRSNDYVFLNGRHGVPRTFPVGERVVFDIYNKKPYYRRGKNYTVQVNFDLWFPFGFLPERNLADFLFGEFFEVADTVFSRINYGASIDAMETAQSDIDFTVGVQRRERARLANFGTVTVIISKVETTGITSYVYSFVVRYQWLMRFVNESEIEVTLCNMRILKATSCRTGRDLFQDYTATYTLYHLTPPDEDEWRNVLTRCDFYWNLYTPSSTPLCNTYVNANTLT